jgi:non-ribosomal peptide synthase protein (TIGR01720 family)
VWFDAGQQPGLLLVAAYYMVMDGVSWRILVPDLAGAWAAAAAGRPPVLGPAGTSFRRWSQLLAARAHDPAVVAELPAWQEVAGGQDLLLGRRALEVGRDKVSAASRMQVPVPAGLTVPLTVTVPAVFRCGAHEVLLAGLAAAVAEWRGRRDQACTGLLVEVRSHGRDLAGPDADVSRTVGWFASLHPVRLDPGPAAFTEVTAGGPAAGQMLKRIKEQVRAVPGNGLGFGLLRYLNGQTAPVLAQYPPPQIGFNYRGRFTTTGQETSPGQQPAPGTEPAPWRPAQPRGTTDDSTLAEYVLEASGLVHDLPGGPQLQLTLTWAPQLLDEPDITELARLWTAALTGLATHATHPEAGGLTPSDLTLISLDQDQIEKLEFRFGSDDHAEKET